MKESSGNRPVSLCRSDAVYHCPTCADEAIAVRVLRLDQQACLALVEVCHQELSEPPEAQAISQEEVDILLVEDVQVGDVLLVHGGVAIAHLAKEQANEDRRI